MGWWRTLNPKRRSPDLQLHRSSSAAARLSNAVLHGSNFDIITMASSSAAGSSSASRSWVDSERSVGLLVLGSVLYGAVANVGVTTDHGALSRTEEVGG